MTGGLFVYTERCLPEYLDEMPISVFGWDVHLNVWMRCSSQCLDEMSIWMFGWDAYLSVWMRCPSECLDEMLISVFGWNAYPSVWMRRPPECLGAMTISMFGCSDHHSAFWWGDNHSAFAWETHRTVWIICPSQCSCELSTTVAVYRVYVAGDMILLVITGWSHLDPEQATRALILDDPDRWPRIVVHMSGSSVDTSWSTPAFHYIWLVRLHSNQWLVQLAYNPREWYFRISEFWTVPTTRNKHIISPWYHLTIQLLL